MIMREADGDVPCAPQEEELTGPFLSLILDGLTQKRTTPVLKRKRAEALYFDALEAPTDEDEYRMLVEAAYLDPGNADVLLELKEFFDLSLEEDLKATSGIVAIAERRLGKKGFKNYAGLFWGVLETRPYMRARGELANLLVEAGRLDEAAAEWEALLALNPNDNQGFRYFLLPFALERARLDKADALFNAYPNEDKQSIIFCWCRVLECVLRKDEARASQALAIARARNGFAEAYILGHRQIAKETPERYAPGSREEADSYALELQSAWNAHPEALKWLARQPKAKK